ncbi:MAG: flagellar hook-basal body complex protein [Ignavibacteria bacterium]
MSLISSFFSGVSGLRNHQTMMDVIGNNISNVNSIGFKSSRVTFADTFNQFIKAGANPATGSTGNTGGTNSFQVGLGMKVNSIDRNWNQGTFETTGIVTDLALQGKGMFILKNNGQQFYSRAGAFSFDSTGNLVDPANGAIVQGKVANGLGEIPAGNSLQDIKIDNNLKLPAIATTTASFGGNLSSGAPITRTQVVNQTGALTQAGPNTSTSSIYDANGNMYSLVQNYTYASTAGTVDTYNLSYDIQDSTGKSTLAGGAPVSFATANFDTALSGALTGVTVTDTSVPPVTATGNVFTIPTPTGTTLNFNVDPSTMKTASATALSSTFSSSADAGRTPTIVTGSSTIFDSLGSSNVLSIKYTKTSDNNWNWSASFPNGTTTGLQNNSGTISFNTDGSINAINPPNPAISYTPASGAKSQVMKLDFGTGITGISQTSGSSNLAALSQDGAASATLANINIDQYGSVVGVFSNGFSRTLAQIMTATFPNLSGLNSVGDSMYTVSANSGNPYISNLGEASNTTLQSGALEQSNVNLSEEFTKMIVSQRGFQANSKVITTADGLLQEIVQLVR